MHQALIALALLAAPVVELPIPGALREAKTVYLVNAGVHSKTMEPAIKTISGIAALDDCRGGEGR